MFFWPEKGEINILSVNTVEHSKDSQRGGESHNRAKHRVDLRTH